jgi:2-(1,2-epoxy-1,2-dihydrophenyl)acetyl-CoA isomerase
MTDVVLVEAVGATRVLTINRPHARNSLTPDALRALTDAFREASGDRSVRCLVLAGAGDHFCAGADLHTILADPGFDAHLEHYMDAFHDLVGAVVRCEKPTIAMVDGAAVGFGADLALACDLRVVSTRAFVQEKFVNIGLMPDGGGTFWLPRLVGTAKALQMILFAERLDAAELLRLGVVRTVAEPDGLREATLAVAREVESGPPLAFAAVKRCLYANLGSIDDALRRERDEQLKLLRSADFSEGVAAWKQRRAPRFQGR